MPLPRLPLDLGGGEATCEMHMTKAVWLTAVNMFCEVVVVLWFIMV